MTKPISRLSLLMPLLNVTGRELACALQVDHSLVSKWKNNHRRIPDRPDSLDKIAEYFINKDAQSSMFALAGLLGIPESETRPADQSELKIKLKQWLQDPAPVNGNSSTGQQFWLSQNSYVCPAEIFPGSAGRKDAVLNIIDTVLSLPSSTELWVITQENPSWVEEDPTFTALLRQKIIQLNERGHHLKIIYWLNHQTNSLQNLIRDWLPMQMDHKISTWYFPMYSPSTTLMTYYIVPGYAVMSGVMTNAGLIQRLSIVFRDPATVKAHEHIFRSYLGESQSLLEVHDSHQQNERVQKILVAARHIREKSTFLQSHLPSSLLLPQDLSEQLIEIDGQNELLQLADLQQNNRLEHASWLEDIILQKSVRHVYNLSSLRQASRQAQIHDKFLSVLTGNPVYISQHIFRSLLRLLADALLANDQLEIALLDDERYGQASWPNLLLISNTLVFSWGEQTGQTAVSARESTLLHAFEKFTESQWQQIPLVCRDRQHVASLLREISQSVN